MIEPSSRCPQIVRVGLEPVIWMWQYGASCPVKPAAPTPVSWLLRIAPGSCSGSTDMSGTHPIPMMPCAVTSKAPGCPRTQLPKECRALWQSHAPLDCACSRSRPEGHMSSHRFLDLLDLSLEHGPLLHRIALHLINLIFHSSNLKRTCPLSLTTHPAAGEAKCAVIRRVDVSMHRPITSRIT